MKVLFNNLSLNNQNNLLKELLIEQELQGKVVQEAQKIVSDK